MYGRLSVARYIQSLLFDAPNISRGLFQPKNVGVDEKVLTIVCNLISKNMMNAVRVFDREREHFKQCLGNLWSMCEEKVHSNA